MGGLGSCHVMGEGWLRAIDGLVLGYPCLLVVPISFSLAAFSGGSLTERCCLRGSMEGLGSCPVRGGLWARGDRWLYSGLWKPGYFTIIGSWKVFFLVRYGV